jgi:hypothetical protein
MVLSHARQFYGGPPKFKPNPKLVRGFSADQSRPPVNDPNLRTQGAGRTFMNTRNQETLPPNQAVSEMKHIVPRHDFTARVKIHSGANALSLSNRV